MRRSLGLEARPSGSGGSTTFSAGDEVYVQSFDARGTVSEVYDSDLLVTMGNVKTLVPKSDVLRSKPTATGRSKITSGPSRNRQPESTTREPQSHAVTSLDVRGMSVDEAWPLVDKALDNASLSGLHELRVIHGRGTGRLSHGIREFLKEHPQVDSLTSAPEREGGSGVTIVQLR
jgi:DNA mismatch repair protein MutS2